MRDTVTYVERVHRVVVVGGPGSGKSTLAREAALALSAVHIELDAIWWQAGWVHREPAGFRVEVRRLLTPLPRWIADGNYVDEVASELWPLADALVWIDLRRRTAFRRAVLRSARRLVTRQELWNGNRESLDVLSPRSLLRLWSRWPSYSDRIREMLGTLDAGDLEVVRLQRPRDVRRWLEELAER
jgi:adenylate kinase family enzyme